MRTTNETNCKKEEVNKEKNYRKKERMREKGITLIALVVTIIILLILAGVTLNIALSDNGLFNKTKKASEKYEQAQSEEEDLISQFATQMYNEYVGATVEGYDLSENEKTVTINGTTSGLGNSNQGNFEGVEDNGSQIFNTDKEMNWKVWDFDGNILRIIGDPTEDTLTLKGAAGYNNGVWAMDQICKILYSNGKDGVNATNLKRTDIQKVSTYDYTKYKHLSNGWAEVTETTSGDTIQFGESKKYKTENAKYPNLWNINDQDWTYKYDNGTTTGEDKECKVWEKIGTKDGQMDNEMINGNTETIFKQSYYYHNYKQNEFINEIYYDLIFKDVAKKYWLAGRYSSLFEETCGFGLQCLNAGGEVRRCERTHYLRV